MTNKKILYIHGLSSSGASSTVVSLRQLLPQVIVLSPDLPINPYDALELLHDICQTEKPDLIIGTSMGGMFAQQMHGYKKILVNPAFHVSEFMRMNIGVQSFMNPRVDGVNQYDITPELCDAYQAIEKNQFKEVTPFDKDNTYAFFGDKDELVNCKDEYLAYYTNYEIFDGEHRLNYDVLNNVIVPYIKQAI